MHYKAPDNKLHFIDPQFAKLLPPGSVQISDAEAEAMRPKPSAADIRRGQIAARLAQIDTESIRALRAVTASSAKGKPVPAFDANKLEALETEAAALRAELATMG